jgi:hypothetical protein
MDFIAERLLDSTRLELAYLDYISSGILKKENDWWLFAVFIAETP